MGGGWGKRGRPQDGRRSCCTFVLDVLQYERKAHTQKTPRTATGVQGSVLYRDAGHDATRSSLQKDYRDNPRKSASSSGGLAISLARWGILGSI